MASLPHSLSFSLYRYIYIYTVYGHRRTENIVPHLWHCIFFVGWTVLSCTGTHPIPGLILRLYLHGAPQVVDFFSGAHRTRHLECICNCFQCLLSAGREGESADGNTFLEAEWIRKRRVDTFIRTHTAQAHTHKHTHTHTHTHTQKHTHKCTNTHTHTHTYKPTHKHIHSHILTLS